MKLPSLTFLALSVLGAVRRFPGTLLAAVTGTAAVWLLLHEDPPAIYDGRIAAYPSPLDNQLPRIWMVAQLGLPLFTGLTALADSRNWSKVRHWALLGGGLLLLLAYGWTLPGEFPMNLNRMEVTRYLVLLAVAHLFVAVAPYLNQLRISDFWNYNRQLFANLVVGAAYTLILWGGLSAALLAVDRLFNLNVDYHHYPRLLVLLAGLFNTVFFLHHFPARYVLEETEADYHAVFKNLCKYILIPIVGLYFLILYAYSFKILLSWELPNGWVSSLVLGFSVAGIFTYLLNYLLPQHDDTALPRLYRRWFWWALAPMVALLFVAVMRRIGDYGITEPRYFVLLLGCWLLICCGYFIFAKLDNIKFIPISLALLGLVSVFGPLSAFRVSIRSQKQVLKYLLVKNNRFADGKAQPGKTELTGDEAGRITLEFDYLAKLAALGEIKDWFPAPIDTVFRQGDKFVNYNPLQEWLKIGPSYVPDERRIWVRTYPEIDQVSILGFATFYPLQTRNTEEGIKRQSRYFRLSGSGTALEWRELRGQNDLLLDSFDLRPTLRTWNAQKPDYQINLLPAEAAIDLTGRTATLRLLITEGEVLAKNDVLHAGFLNGSIFLREKPVRR